AFAAVSARVAALAESPLRPYWQNAMLAAALDGLPHESPQAWARSAGIVTEWRVAGPFGRLPNVDFDRPWPPEQNGAALASQSVGEPFDFPDGLVEPPNYFENRGVFYASAEIT